VTEAEVITSYFSAFMWPPSSNTKLMAEQDANVRYFDNPWLTVQQIDETQLKLDPTVKLEDVVQENLSQIELNQKNILSMREASVYCGCAGIAFMYLKLFIQSSSSQREEYLQRAKWWAEHSLQLLTNQDKKVVTFLCGAPGVYAVAAVIQHHLQQSNERDKFLNQIKAYENQCTEGGTKIPSEHLYGRAGYLYTLQYLEEELPDKVFENLQWDVSASMRNLWNQIYQHGLHPHPLRGIFTNDPNVLIYFWDDDMYLGAAHGIAGIVYTLLHFPECIDSNAKKRSIVSTLDYLLRKKFKSGNFPAEGRDNADYLVQWCHGAPGFVYLFTAAYRVLKDTKYLNEALAAGEVTWARGLLKKSRGLCHGVTGNAYPFLHLYQTTNDSKWLWRAIKFCEFSLRPEIISKMRTPDTPFSLYEGLAGPTCFYFDMNTNPKEATFPAWEATLRPEKP
jgi:lantibiotic modifying enzyme